MNPTAAVDYLPLSALNDFFFCPRRAALKFIDGLRGANEHTALGDLAHQAVDTPGYEHRAGWELLRALPLFSDSLGLTGKADLVEVRRDNASGIVEARPIEYKKGPKRRFDNDEVQLCAQALCLEEMLGLRIESGAIYHAASSRRGEIVFDVELRRQTTEALAALRSLIAGTQPPPPELKPQCEGCSLHVTCIPELGAVRPSLLFAPRNYS